MSLGAFQADSAARAVDRVDFAADVLVGLPGLAERVAVDDLRRCGQVAPLQDALLRERMIPAEQDLITIFADDLKIQAAAGL